MLRQRLFHLLDVAGEVLASIEEGLVVEIHDEHFVLRDWNLSPASSAAASTFSRLSRMLPLLSMISPIETGTSSRLKSLIGCWRSVLVDRESALRQVRDQMAALVDDRGMQHHQPRIGAKDSPDRPPAAARLLAADLLRQQQGDTQPAQPARLARDQNRFVYCDGA